ncbi:MAG: alkaline phosphatase family protein [Actinomycetota bacterium]
MRPKLPVTLLLIALLAVASSSGGPAAASSAPGLTYAGTATAATGDAVALSATLNDQAGNPLAGRQIRFTLADQPAVTAVTDTAGFAAASLNVLKAAGPAQLRVSGGGESASVPFTVTPPSTSLTISRAGAGGGEPSIDVEPEGNVYVSAVNGPILARSTNAGTTWKKLTTPFTSAGDTTINHDTAGSVYLSNLNLTTFQIETYKSTKQGDGPWVKGAAPVAQGGSTDQPFLADRQWIDTYIPPGKTTDQARVYVTYHDLTAPSQIWINVSTDGGKTFGAPQDIIATSPVAEAYTACNSIPGGAKVVQSGPHAGRVYVAWIAGDPVTNPATGCNLTQLDTFHTIWIAWSDDADAATPTWTSQQVFDGGIGHDGSALFADLTLDDAGNPYVGFSMNIGTEWDTYVEASFDGGTTWNGRSDGTGAPYRVNADIGTHYFPAIAAGAPGHVDVAYLRTPTVVETTPYGKPLPNGGANADWKLFVAQSLDLNLGSPTWTATEVTPQPMHHGNICVLGLFCAAVPGADRSLLDFIDVAIDGAGNAHVSYSDNGGKSTETDVANQVSGPSAFLSSGSDVGPALEGIPRYDHVAIVVLENEDFDASFSTSSPAKYLNKTLVPKGVLNTGYYATGHVSLDNYIAMTSGQPANPLSSSDCEANNFWSCVQPQHAYSNGANIADQLEAAGLSWKGYVDGTTTPCVHAAYDPTDPQPDPYQGDGSSPEPAGPDYADRHNPFIYYDDIVGDDARCRAHVRPFTELAGDMAADTLPAFAFLSPDTCNDGHDAPCSDGRPGGLTTADRFLSDNVPALLGYLQAHNGLLIVTFDEANPASDFSGCCHGGPGGQMGFGGKIGLLAIGPGVRPGQRVATKYDHASLLRTLEDTFGIGTYLNNAAVSDPMRDLFE